MLRNAMAMDDDLVLIYDSRKIGEYLAAVTEEETIVHWAR